MNGGVGVCGLRCCECGFTPDVLMGPVHVPCTYTYTYAYTYHVLIGSVHVPGAHEGTHDAGAITQH